MGNLLDSVAEFFTRDGWEFTRHDDEKRIRMVVNSDRGRWPCQVYVDAEERVVFFHSVWPLNVPADKRAKMAEFLMRMNRMSLFGSFLLDFDTGEIRFETYVFGNEETVDRDEMSAAVQQNLGMMNRHLDCISKVLSTDLTPAEAVTELVTGMPIDRKYTYN